MATACRRPPGSRQGGRGRKKYFGLRPDDIFLKGHGPSTGDGVHEKELRVVITEPLGNETLVFAEFAGRERVARMLNLRPVQPGESIAMQFDPGAGASFDAATGVSLTV